MIDPPPDTPLLACCSGEVNTEVTGSQKKILISVRDEMETNNIDPGEEPPTLLWGLDPVFSAYAKLYIKDILEMPESTQVAGSISNVNMQ